MADRNVNGILIGDATTALPVGTRLDFKPETFPIGTPVGEYTLDNWDHYWGALLLIIISDGSKIFVHGSAVLVAPGVAIAARHVIEPFIKDLGDGKIALGCASIMESQLMMWNCRKMTLVGDDSDLAILILSYASNLPPKNLFRFAAITTRYPKIGEQVSTIGFSAAAAEGNVEAGFNISGHVRVSVGPVRAQYPVGRDRVMLPSPALEIATSTTGGMSGGPVFEQSGHLVGIVSSSFSAGDHVGPTFISLLWPALTIPIDAEWPNGINSPGTPLCEFGRLCAIDRPDALRRIAQRTFAYTPWEDAC